MQIEMSSLNCAYDPWAHLERNRASGREHSPSLPANISRSDSVTVNLPNLRVMSRAPRDMSAAPGTRSVSRLAAVQTQQALRLLTSSPDIYRSELNTQVSAVSADGYIKLAKCAFGISLAAGLGFASTPGFTFLHEFFGHQLADSLVSKDSRFPLLSVGNKDSGKDVEIHGYDGGLARVLNEGDTAFGQTLGAQKTRAFVSLAGVLAETGMLSSTAYLAGRLLNNHPARVLQLLTFNVMAHVSTVSYAVQGLEALPGDIEEKGGTNHDSRNVSWILADAYNIDRKNLVRILISCLALAPVASFATGVIHSQQTTAEALSNKQLKAVFPQVLVSLGAANHALLESISTALAGYSENATVLSAIEQVNHTHQQFHSYGENIPAGQALTSLSSALHQFFDHLQTTSNGRTVLRQLKDYVANENSQSSVISKKSMWQGVKNTAGAVALSSPLIRIMALNSSSKIAENSARAALISLPVEQMMQTASLSISSFNSLRSAETTTCEKGMSLLTSAASAAATGVYLSAISDWTSSDFGVKDFEDIVGGWQLPAAISLTALSALGNLLTHRAAAARVVENFSQPTQL